MNKTQKGKLNNLHIAPRKVRLIAGSIKGMPVWKAEAILMQRPQRSAEPILKLLRSTIANAKNNAGLDASKLKVQSIIVDGGQVMKRFMPRAFGRATPILKRMSHVTLVLEEAEKSASAKFNVVDIAKEKREAKKSARKQAEKDREKGKKSKKEEASDEAPLKPRKESQKEFKGPKSKDKPKGVFQKMFRRKSV